MHEIYSRKCTYPQTIARGRIGVNVIKHKQAHICIIIVFLTAVNATTKAHTIEHRTIGAIMNPSVQWNQCFKSSCCAYSTASRISKQMSIKYIAIENMDNKKTLQSSSMVISMDSVISQTILWSKVASNLPLLASGRGGRYATMQALSYGRMGFLDEFIKI